MANIKECFVSRWGEDGVIMECDYSQLEVIGAAEMSGDENMKQDILDGVDSHSQSAAWLNPQYSYTEIREGYLKEEPYFTKLRKNAKAPRFELQYGAGASSIANNNNISKDAAQGFIDRYYDRYSQLKAFQDSVAESVIMNGVVKEKVNIQGRLCDLECGVWRSPTGRGYYFEQTEAPKWMRGKGEYTSYSPTKFKNYPMQGFATGDIVPEMLGRVMRRIMSNPAVDRACLPINTVHDSILFDVKEGVKHTVGLRLKEEMEKVGEAMKDRFGLELTLPFHVDVEAGVNWNEMKSLGL